MKELHQERVVMRILGFLVSVLFILVIAAVIVPSFINWNDYKPQIIQAAKDAIGLDIAIDGDLGISIFPSPSAQISNVSVSVPSEETPFTQLAAANVYLDLFPLLGGTVSVSSITLESPDIRISRAEDGRFNFMTERLEQLSSVTDATSEQSETSTGAAPNVEINNFTIENGTFSYIDQASGAEYVLTDINTAFSMESLAGPYALEGTLSAQGLPLALDGSLRNEGGADSYNIQLTAGPQDTPDALSFSGLASLGEAPDAQGELRLSLARLGDISPLLHGAAIPQALGDMPFELEGLASLSTNSAELSNLNLKAADITLTGSVSVTDIKTNPSLSLNLQEGQASALSGTIRMTENSVRFDDVTASYASSSATASGALSFGANPNLDLTLNAPSLNIDEVMQRAGRSLEGLGGNGSSSSEPAALGVALPFDVNVDVAVAALTYMNDTYKDLRLKAEGGPNGLNIFQANASLPQDLGTIRMVGEIAGPGTLSGINLRSDFSFSSLEQVIATYQPETSELLPFTIGAASGMLSLTGAPEELVFDLGVNALNAELRAGGTAVNVLGETPQATNLSFALKHPNFDEFLQAIQPEREVLENLAKPINVSFDVTQDDNVYTLSNLQGSLGPTSLAGDITLNLGTAKPEMTATIDAGKLPVDAFLPGGAVSASDSASGGEQQGLRWPRTAIDTSWMHLANVTLALNAEQLTYSTWTFNDPEVNATLRDGTFNLETFNAGMYGGRINASAKAVSKAAAGQPLEVSGTANLTDVGLQSLVTSLAGAPVIQSQGTVNFVTELQSSGISMAALVFGLKGDGTVDGTDITIRGIDVADLSQALANAGSLGRRAEALFKTGIRGGTSQFETLQGVFTVTEGVVTFNPLTLTGEEAVIITIGDVSLPAWTVDMESVITVSEPEDAPPLRISYRGALDNPGQSFAESAIENYLNQKITEKLDEVIQDKIGGELGGALGDVLGGGNRRQAQPQGQEQEQPNQPQRADEPDEALRGVLRGILSQ